MKCPRAAIFDLDNTLAFAFEPLSKRVAEGLSELLEHIPVAIMSGAAIERMEKNILPELPAHTKLERLSLFPDTAARCYVYTHGTWERVYSHRFTKEDYETIVSALKDGIEETGVGTEEPHWGERMIARETQVTFSGLGVDAPAEKKQAWDPDRKKRAILKTFLDERLRGLPVDIRITSRTAIDITQSGVNKAEGVKWFAAHLKIEPKEMLFVGDDLGEGGNDSMVIPTGIETRQVAHPDETAVIIEELVQACRAA